MGLVVKPATFSAGATIIASEHNSDFDTLYNLVNGSLDNANLSASAAIVDTKLAQITTASKVSGAAITLLTSLPSGAGLIPIANLLVSGTSTSDLFYRGDQRLSITPKVKVGSFQRDTSTASGSQAVTGVGFKPKALVFLASTGQAGETSWGVATSSISTDQGCIYNDYNETANVWATTDTNVILMIESGTATYTGTINSLDSDGFTIGWTKFGTPTGTIATIYLAIG